MANDEFLSALDTTRKGKDFAAPGTAYYIPAEEAKIYFCLPNERGNEVLRAL